MNPLALVGVWNGHAFVGNLTLLIVLEFMKTDYNKNAPVNAYIDIPDVYVNRYFIRQLSVNGDKLDFYLPSLEGGFSGKFDNKRISGVWKNDEGEYKIEMKKKTSVTEYNERKPQTPRKPFPYVDEEVLIKTRDNVILSGTFTYPKNKKSTKAVVLAHGSGGMDRDETHWQHKPFMVVADYLTRNGIAVLRYDERGMGKSTGDLSTATDVIFANDAVDAIHYLDDRDDFNFKELGIIGHSKGGLTAMIAANQSDDVDFIVLHGSPVLKFDEEMKLQGREFAKALKRPKLVGVFQAELIDFIVDLAIKGTEKEVIRKSVLDYLDRRINSSKSEEELISLATVKRDAVQYSYSDAFSSVWIVSTSKFDTPNVLKNLDLPILGIWGSKDINIPPYENYFALKKVIDESDSHDRYGSEALILEDMNHYFQKSKTGSQVEYDVLKETIAPEVLKITKDWILRDTRQFSFKGLFRKIFRKLFKP